MGFVILKRVPDTYPAKYSDYKELDTLEEALAYPKPFHYIIRRTNDKNLRND